MSSIAKMFEGSAVARISVEPARFTGTTVCFAATSSGISWITEGSMSNSSRLMSGTPYCLATKDESSCSWRKPSLVICAPRREPPVFASSRAFRSCSAVIRFSRTRSSPIRSFNCPPPPLGPLGCAGNGRTGAPGAPLLRPRESPTNPPGYRSGGRGALRGLVPCEGGGTRADGRCPGERRSRRQEGRRRPLPAPAQESGYAPPQGAVSGGRNRETTGHAGGGPALRRRHPVRGGSEAARSRPRRRARPRAGAGSRPAARPGRSPSSLSRRRRARASRGPAQAPWAPRGE